MRIVILQKDQVWFYQNIVATAVELVIIPVEAPSMSLHIAFGRLCLDMWFEACVGRSSFRKMTRNLKP